MKHRLAAIIALALVLGAAPRAASGAYLPQERIPTDSPVYRDLERLATRYGVAPRFLSSRPLRRVEALAYLRGLAETTPEAESDPAFRRAARFLDPEADGALRPLIAAAGDEDERLEISPYTSLLYSEDPRNRPEINRDYRVGLVFAGQVDTSAIFVADFYEGNASQGGRGTPDFGDFNSLIQGVNFNSWVNEAYLEAPVSKIRVLLGRTWLRWGPGETGTLALSDAAPALDMLRAEAGMFRRFRYQQFVALLDPGPQTYLAGHRVEWQAGGGLSVGLTEMARFDGTSQALLYLIPFVPYSFWEKRPKTVPAGSFPGDTALSKNNVLWAADASWVIRPGWRVYGEFLLDDFSFSTDYKPDMIGYQAGLEWRRPLGGSAPGGEGTGSAGTAPGGGTPGGGAGSALSASLEYDRVHNYVYSAWHAHDFELHGFPIGYVLGPDAEVLSGGIALEWGADWEFRLRGEWRRKGEGDVGEPWFREDGEVDAAVLSGVVEREIRAAGSVIYSPARWLRLQATLGASEVENRGHVPSDPDSEAPFTLSARLAW